MGEKVIKPKIENGMSYKDRVRKAIKRGDLDPSYASLKPVNFSREELKEIRNKHNSQQCFN